MLSKEEVKEISADCRIVTFNQESGKLLLSIGYKAAYDQTKEEKGFYLISPEATDSEVEGVSGVLLSDSFLVEINNFTGDSKNFPKCYFPRKKYKGLSKQGKYQRHINIDGSACLCGIFEAEQFLRDDPGGKYFIEDLLIPWLYGQTYYNLHSEWPMPTHEHGLTGVLESYAEVGSSFNAEEILECLVIGYPEYKSRLKKIFQFEDPPKGGLPCICKPDESGDHMRRCHPKALKGLRDLWKNL